MERNYSDKECLKLAASTILISKHWDILIKSINKTEMLAIIINHIYKKKRDITRIKNEAKLSYNIKWFFNPMDERMNHMGKYLYM